MPMSRIAIAALAAACMSVSLHAQDYPARPVKIVVPFAVGGPADIYARVLGAKLGESFGQPFVIENRPGAGAVVGTDVAAKSAPDGYTLLLMSNAHTVNETLIPSKPYSLTRDFVAVAPVNYSDLMLVLGPGVHASSVQELLALARAQPGKLNYASSGPGTPYHMAGELFKAMAGVDIVHIPYKGSSGARTDVLGGQVQMMFDAITTMAPNVEAGKVRALGTTGKVRSTVLPNVPTVSEAGVPGYEAVIWLGFKAPMGTPRPIIDKLNAEIRKAVDSPEVKGAWAKQGAVGMSMSPDEFGEFLRGDIDKWAKIVKISGARRDR
jgi:tripartite-type tricarboxylate transporter receptor subunit TctC